MEYQELKNKIKKLYDRITAIESSVLEKAGGGFSATQITQEYYDYSSLYDELKTVLYPVLQSYRLLFSDYNDNFSEKAKKVYFVALCEMVKQDFNRGMLITFETVTNQPIETNKYYDLITIVSASQNLHIKTQNGRRLFEETYIAEAGVPRNLTATVTSMFRIYWKYFRTVDIEERRLAISSYLSGKEFEKEYIIDPSDETIFDNYRKRVLNFSQKATAVFYRLDDIFSTLDYYPYITEPKDLQELFKEISNKLGYDITRVVRDDQLISIYQKYLSVIPLSKLRRILYNLGKNETINIPSYGPCKVNDVYDSILSCGTYTIRGNRYDVVIDPNIGLSDMIAYRTNTVLELSKDYYFYSSKEYFDVDIDGKIIQPRILYHKGITKYVWLGKLPVASTATIDGNVIYSSEANRIIGKIIKKYNPENNQSRLIYLLSYLKINMPNKTRSRLYYRIDNYSKVLLCVSNARGVFFRDNVRIELPDAGTHTVQYFVNDEPEPVFSDTIQLEPFYLFDKWQGTKYSSTSRNERHSGAFICFKLNEPANISSDYQIIQSYVWNNYYVTEFKAPVNADTIIVDNIDYSFEYATKPGFFIRTHDNELTAVDNVYDLEFVFYNLESQFEYRVTLEHDNEHFSEPILNGSYHVSEMISLDSDLNTGRWTLALWQNQRKLEEESFTIIPHLSYKQESICLEGTRVIIRVTADDNCFLNDFGDYTNSINIDMGPAISSIESDLLTVEELTTTVVIDKLNTSKEITIHPDIWAIRTKDPSSTFWTKNRLIGIEPANTNKTQIGIFTNCSTDLIINNKTIGVQPGLNTLKNYVSTKHIKRKNKINISDSQNRNTVSIVISCLPKLYFKELTINESIIMTLLYEGPVDENLIIRKRIHNQTSIAQERKTHESLFCFNVDLGKASALNNNQVLVDYLDSQSDIPISLFNKLILLPKKSLQSSSLRMQDIINVDKLSEWYFGREDKTINTLPLTLQEIAQQIWR